MPWKTHHEVNFLRGLGTWRDRAMKKEDGYLDGPGRVRLLIAYRDSMHLRERWGDVDPLKVRVALGKLLSGAKHHISKEGEGKN